LKEGGVQACFHYVPLHSAPAGERFGSFHGKDVYTTEVSERLVRLPLYYGMSVADRARVIEVVRAYFGR
ncbi:dTDP-4-amino-4,6-dideoxygalactose transaminase, partial [Adlercreutzia rubneri]|uniref:DegT/DnrJ/EryC1/StrS family aminotransferase n=2 Tax=Adlercreutzia TaxID=447020 RepID=UPI0035284B7E|nr:dTDP-4-amino-4,6-dideoxygalactose transaminase [Adlercreutzia rubneri]